jgi:hypothetical protein
MENITIDVRVDRTIEVNVGIADLIQGINDTPMKSRWNSVSQVLNGVQLSLSELTDNQKEIVKNYLISKLSLFEALKGE